MCNADPFLSCLGCRLWGCTDSGGSDMAKKPPRLRQSNDDPVQSPQRDSRENQDTDAVSKKIVRAHIEALRQRRARRPNRED